MGCLGRSQAVLGSILWLHLMQIRGAMGIVMVQQTPATLSVMEGKSFRLRCQLNTTEVTPLETVIFKWTVGNSQLQFTKTLMNIKYWNNSTNQSREMHIEEEEQGWATNLVVVSARRGDCGEYLCAITVIRPLSMQNDYHGNGTRVEVLAAGALPSSSWYLFLIGLVPLLLFATWMLVRKDCQGDFAGATSFPCSDNIKTSRQNSTISVYCCSMEIFWLVTALLLVVGAAPSEILSCWHHRTKLLGFSDQSVELPCLFSWKGHEPLEHMVVWNVMLNHTREKILVHGQEKQMPEQDSRFSGRTELQKAWFSKRNATLKLHRLSSEEEGTYTCHITTMNPFTRKMCAEVVLSVQTGPEPDSRNNENEEVSCLGSGNSDQTENGEKGEKPRHSSGTGNGPHLLLIGFMPASLLRYLHSY
ncbi:uncharacterized protein [Mobula birostris]|uniref:uncharacterized protein n=1 Tax=Mobula birostris TaxID=1983395 RepID=UPI003B280ADB